MKFQREVATQEFFDELGPLISEHFKEIAHFQDIALDPDWDAYLACQKNEALRVFTARGSDGKLLGYAVYFVRKNLHYKSSFQAVQDILFIQNVHRGKGHRFILWCDDQLEQEGVQVVYHHVKQAHNFGPMLERLGYKCVDHIYARRLDYPNIEKGP